VPASGSLFGGFFDFSTGHMAADFLGIHSEFIEDSSRCVQMQVE